MPDSRLIYDARAGVLIAQRSDVHIRRRATARDLPRVLGERVVDVHFVREQRHYWVRQSAQDWRDMTPAELLAVERWLDRLIGGVRSAHHEKEEGEATC